MFRMFKKGVLLILREKRTFIIFMLIYTILIFLTSLFLENSIAGNFGEVSGYLVVIFLFTSLILSLLYAWILVSRKRRDWATLKCIGYTNRNIITIVSGIILFTSLMGLLIVIEILFHYTAIFTYIDTTEISTGLPSILIGLYPVVITTVLFILVQVISIALIYRKVLKVRPIVALKRVGE